MITAKKLIKVDAAWKALKKCNTIGEIREQLNWIQIDPKDGEFFLQDDGSSGEGVTIVRFYTDEEGNEQEEKNIYKI